MRTFDMTPYYRHAIGFDRLFDMLDSDATRPDWPPYNVERTGENAYRITMAVAGFEPGEIELAQHGNSLVVASHKAAEQGNRQWLHQGIASRNFKQTFSLADYVRVESAQLLNGLLAIDLVREVPEALRPRRIEIKAPGAVPSVQDQRPEQLVGEPELHAKAA